MADKKTYRGSLARPLRVPDRPLTVLTDTDQHRHDSLKDAVHCATEAIQKLGTLCDHYGVSHGNWFALSLALANKHVPGFRVETEKVSGRPVEWDMKRLLRLWWDVQVLVREKTVSVYEACNNLATTDKWMEYSGNSLRKRYEQDAEQSPMVMLLKQVEPSKQAEVMKSLA